MSEEQSQSEPTADASNLRSVLHDIAAVDPARLNETEKSNLFWRFHESAKQWLDDEQSIKPAVPALVSSHRSFFARFFDWLTRPSLPIRLLQDRITSLESERDKLQDLLTQAYERAGIVAVQPEHKGPPAPPIPQRKTMGEMMVEDQQRHAEDYRIWFEGEAKRKAHMTQVKAKAN